MAQQSVDFKPKVDDTHKGDSEKKGEEKETTKPEEKQQQQDQKPSIFGCLNQATNYTNLFNNTGVQVKSIFDGATTGIFQNPSSSLFPDVDLSKPMPSLFGLNLIPPKAKAGSDDSDAGDDDPQDNQDEQKSEEPKQIVMKFEYNPNTEQLMKANVDKFRKNTNEVLEKGSISLEKAKEQDTYFFIYRNSIQQTLYTGQLVQGLSKISPLGQKPENLLLKAVSWESKSEEPSKKYQVDTLKVMFNLKEGCDEFKEQFEKIFK